MKRSVIFTIIVLLSIAPVSPANASDECGFGKQFADNGVKVCEKNLWELKKFNDGFVKYLSIELRPDTDASDVESFNTLSIRCEKKKIRIYIFMDGHIDTSSFEMTESGSLIEFGSLLLKIDSGKVQKWDWKRRFTNQIELFSPDKLLTSFVKAKTRFSFKISREDSPSILVYPKADLLKYRSEFSQAGCKY